MTSNGKRSGLPLLFSTDGMLLRWVLKPESLQICSSAVRMVSCASFLLPAASCRCVDVITVHVNDVPIAGADKQRQGSLLQLGNDTDRTRTTTWPCAPPPAICMTMDRWA